jgi:hypothetical protein
MPGTGSKEDNHQHLIAGIARYSDYRDIVESITVDVACRVVRVEIGLRTPSAPITLTQLLDIIRTSAISVDLHRYTAAESSFLAYPEASAD